MSTFDVLQVIINLMFWYHINMVVVPRIQDLERKP